MKILVVGGAGCIGSHMVKKLALAGHVVVTLDNLSRGYVHINDLCDAHSLSLEKMQKSGDSARYNLGNGKGFSVQQVIDTVKRVANKEFKVIHAEKRAGDPAVLVADSTLAKQALGWTPRFEQLETIIETAWQWETTFFTR